VSRIVIRKPALRYRDEFLAAACRSRSFHRRWGDPPKTPERFRDYLRRHRSPQHEGHFLIDRSTGDLVGVVNVMEIVRGTFQGAYLGYYLFHPFGGLGDNKRSIRLVKRLGFRREGLSPRYLMEGAGGIMSGGPSCERNGARGTCRLTRACSRPWPVAC